MSGSLQSRNYHYQGLIEMSQDITTIILEIEENGGEITPELELAFNGLNMEVDERLFRVYNIIKELEGLIPTRDAEIKRLTDRKKSIQNSVDNWKKLSIELTKQAGKLNGSGNPNHNASGVSFTVTKSKSVQVEDDFHDPEFVKYKIGDAVPESIFTQVAKYIQYHLGLPEVKREKVVDKVGIKKRIEELAKTDELMEGASIIEKENITMR